MRRITVSVGVLWIVGIAAACFIGLAFGAGYEVGHLEGGKDMAAFYNDYLKKHGQPKPD